MKCDSCGKNDAIIQIQRMENNAVNEIRLCLECAGKYGVAGPDGKLKIELVQEASEFFFEKETKENPSTSCPVCGRNIREIIQEERAGCSTCYESFKTELGRHLHKLGYNPVHKGRFPKRFSTWKRILIDKERLEKELKNAIQAENYESAASLRDKIAELDTISERKSDDIFFKT